MKAQVKINRMLQLLGLIGQFAKELKIWQTKTDKNQFLTHNKL